MRRPGEGGLETAADFVLALRSRLEPRHLVLDAELDSLVVARLEMQTVVILSGAPVAAEQSICRPEEYRGSDRFPGAHRELHHQRVAHGPRRFAEEGSRQIRLVPVPQKGIPMKCIHAIE